MAETMFWRVARALWETNLLRDATKPDGVQNLPWDDLCIAARSDVIAKVLFDRNRQQAFAVLTAMREPTEKMVVAGDAWRDHCSDTDSIYTEMIKAALHENA